MVLQSIRSLQRDEDGTSVMEFGLIAIPMMMMMMGTLDAGHTYYVKSILSGELNKLARSSSLEGASVVSQQQIIDARLAAAVKTVAPTAVVDVDRRYYKTFSEAAAAQAEVLVSDVNHNGACNSGDTYIDRNGNFHWDADGGDDGQGSAKDVVIIKVNVSYERFFPIHKMVMNLPNNVVLISDSILANQPYGNQTLYTTAVTRTC